MNHTTQNKLNNEKMIKVSTFQVDCTPPAGSMIGLVPGSKARAANDPLYMRAVVLDCDGEISILAALDYCALLNNSYDDFRYAIANAVNADAGRIIIHCVHQHDAPLVDFQATKYIGEENYYSRTWFNSVIKKCGEAARVSLRNAVKVKKIGYSETRLHGYASNRRIKLPDGSVQMRSSRCSDKSIKSMPTGIIDPMLRTIAFTGSEDRIIASMSFYATHPQTCNEGKNFSADAPGEALSLLKNDYPESMHIFCTGAAGNVGVGKYSSPNNLDGNKRHFGFLLANTIAHNLQSLRYRDANEATWSQISFPFPVKSLDRGKMVEEISSPETPLVRKISNIAILCCDDYHHKPDYIIRLFNISGVKLLFLAGEPFVEYQIYVQSLIPDEFIAVAANCCDNFLYLPTSDAISTGYESNFFCRTTSEFEHMFKSAAKKLLIETT